MTEMWLISNCRIIPYNEVPIDMIPDMPHGHDYTVNWKNPNWQVLCKTITGYMALIEDARFVKV